MKERPSTERISTEVSSQLYQTTYLNGLQEPGVDLCQLSRQEVDFATTLLSRISDNEITEISFIARDQAIKPLADLFYHAYRQSGQSDYQEVGIGFPMFYIAADEDNSTVPLAAPLFIWRADFRPDYADKWHLKIDRSDVLPNKMLLTFFKEQYNVDLTEKFNSCLHTEGDIGEAIYHLCYELIVQLDLTDQRSTTTTLPVPATINDSKGSIHWSGVLNLFGIQQNKLWQRTKMALPTASKATETPAWSHPYGIFPTDPMQAVVMQYFQTHPLIVNGEPGTGVYQTAANIAVNCLSNEKNLLIISREGASLNAVRRHLASHSLDTYCLNLFSDSTSQKEVIPAELIKYDREQYNLNLQKALRNQAALVGQYDSVTQPIFGKYTWTNVVGLFLATNGKEPSAQLNSHLNFNDYQWSYQVYNTFSEKVANGINRFENIGTTEHPLSNLNSILFLEYNAQESLDRIRKSTDQLKEEARTLQQKYINKLHTYTVKLTHYYNDGLKEFQKRNNSLLELIGDLDSEHGIKGTKTGLLSTGKLKLTGIFSNSSKSILERQKKVRADYQFMRNRFAENNFFDYSFPAYTGSEKIPQIQATLASFRAALQEFQQTVPSLIQKNLDTLSGTNQVSGMGYEPIVREMENELRRFLGSVNKTRLFEAKIDYTAHATREQQEQLEEIVHQLDAIKFNLRDFDHFYSWQKYWLQLSQPEQKVVLALTQVKPNDWVAAFQSWYLQQFLSQYHHEGIPEDNQHYQRFLAALDGLGEQIPGQITARHKSRNVRSPRINPTLFTNANEEFSAIRFLHKNTARPEDIISQYPVVMTTPELAIEWIDPQQNIFDAIIILETNELSFSHYFPLLEMAPRIVGFTNSRSNPGATEYTLLDHLIDQDTQQVDLLYHHRPGPAAITDFYHQQFKAVRDIHFYNKTKDQNAVVHQPLDLSYRSEQNTKMHYAEVLENILKDIKPVSKDYQYPDLRIVVEEDHLRNFLFYRLYHKREGHTSMAGVLKRLFPGGVKIYAPENQDGGTADCLVYIQSPASPYRNSSVLQKHLARVRQKVYFLHSDKTASYADLETVSSNQKKYRRNVQCDYFVDEVIERLSNYIPSKQLIKHAWINEVYVPILIKPEGADSVPIAVILDGIGDRRGALALDWERKYRDLLTFYGLEYVYVWSADWWKNESEAVAELVDKINERTAQYVG